MNPSLYSALETAAFSAWPALEPEETCCGWRLRYAGGYTKRANSANCTLAAADLDDAQIAEIESRYRRRGLTPVFRLTSVAAPPNIDRTLAQRGYRHVDPSRVMLLSDLDRATPSEPLHTLPAERWLSTFMQINAGRPPVGQDLHLRMLQAIAGPAAFAVERLGSDPVSCGLGVVRDGTLGLFDLATTPARRRQGWATTLCGKLLAWGRAQGARTAYLQVFDSNLDAIRLYERLGFQSAYAYWYRVADEAEREPARAGR